MTEPKIDAGGFAAPGEGAGKRRRRTDAAPVERAVDMVDDDIGLALPLQESRSGLDAKHAEAHVVGAVRLERCGRCARRLRDCAGYRRWAGKIHREMRTHEGRLRDFQPAREQRQ